MRQGLQRRHHRLRHLPAGQEPSHHRQEKPTKVFEIDLFVGKIKKQEWKALGIVAELHGDGDTWRTFHTVANRGDMLEADWGNLKKMWDALHGGEAELVC